MNMKLFFVPLLLVSVAHAKTAKLDLNQEIKASNEYKKVITPEGTTTITCQDFKVIGKQKAIGSLEHEDLVIATAFCSVDPHDNLDPYGQLAVATVTVYKPNSERTTYLKSRVGVESIQMINYSQAE